MIFDNVFTEDAFKQITNLVAVEPLTFGAVSTDANLPIFKSSDLSNELKKYSSVLTEYLNQSTENTFELISSHLNAQPTGYDGAWHVDSIEGDATHAASFYCHNVDWNESFGGYLLIGNVHSGESSAILPHKNRLVLHESDIPHCALSPNQRAGTIVRYSLTLKLKKII